MLILGHTPMNLRRDLPASIVVFLVAVPLSLGIALASGAPIIAGLIGAAAGGIVTGLLAGAPLQVSGPAAGLTVVVFGMVQQLGWEVMCVATACAGAVQLLLGWFKVARGALLIAPSVVHGMLAGIGISIALAQLHVMIGGSPDSSPLRNLIALPSKLGGMNVDAAILGVVTIAVLVLWKRIPWPAVRSVPGALVAVLLGTALSLLVKMDVKRVDLPDALAFTQLKLPADWGVFIVAVLTLAVIASVESLLCAVATDKLHSGARCDLDKELSAQGAGNLISGLLGGLPVTGVIVRSSANIAANAASRWSAVLHGVWVVLSVLLLSGYIEAIPLAVLAGLLVHVGVNLVNFHHIRDLTVHNEVKIYWVTVIGVTCINLLAGVGLGVAVSVFFALRRLSLCQVVVTERDGVQAVQIRGTLTFATVPRLSAELAKLPAGSSVEVDLAVDYIDHAAFEAIQSWAQNHGRTGGKVCIEESGEEWYKPAAEGRPRSCRTVGGKSA